MINIMLTKKNNQISHESFGDYVYYAIQINLMSVTLVFSVSRGSCKVPTFELGRANIIYLARYQ